MLDANCDLIFQKTEAKPLSARLVTVAISLCNYEQFIVECLNSVIWQTVPEIELIVVDDCSSADRSCEVARAWMEQHSSRFAGASLVRHRSNRGLAEARNTGFRLAGAEYVFVLDADNMIYPRAVGRLLDAIVGTEYGAAYTQLEFFGCEERLGHADVWSKAKFKNGNYVDAMALVRKASWENVGGYTHMRGGWEDYDFWCKFIDHGIEALFVPEVLCRYRVHGSSMLRTRTNRYYGRLVKEMMLRHAWLEL
jgi:glycosyltransferase involved in cell wall biosynthesis